MRSLAERLEQAEHRATWQRYQRDLLATVPEELQATARARLARVTPGDKREAFSQTLGVYPADRLEALLIHMSAAALVFDASLSAAERAALPADEQFRLERIRRMAEWVFPR